MSKSISEEVGRILWEDDEIDVFVAQRKLEELINTKVAEARIELADVLAKHSQRADYFKSDTQVIMTSNLEWVATLNSKDNK